jgi:TolB-like protein
MKTLRAALLAAGLLGFVAGCEEDWAVNFESDPPGAKCYLKGRYLGTTPIAAKVRIDYMPPYSEAWGASAEFVFPGHERAECPKLSGHEGTQFTLATSAPAGADFYKDRVLVGVTPFLHNFNWAHEVKAVLPKYPKRAQGGIRVSCNLTVVRISDGAVVAGAIGQSPTDRLKALGEGLSEKLREQMPVRGEPLAVVSLRNQSGTPEGQALADELADKLTGALVRDGWFDVKEQIGLRSILAEKDLGTTDLVKSDKVREKLAGLKYLVIGGVSVSERRTGK